MTKQTPPSSRTPFRVSPSHERVLQALGRFDHLTAEQTRRLLFGAGSLTYAQAKYRELATHGYVLAVPVGRSAPHGSGPLVYSLDRRGRAYLHTLGVDVPRRLRQSEERERSSPHLRHSLAVADVLILCALLGRQAPRLTLDRMRGERELKAHPVAVVLADGTRRGVAPDAWVDFRINHPVGEIEQACLAFEVDCGTEWQVAWRRKVRSLLAYETGPYGEAFGVDSLTMVVIAPTDQRRDQLRHWTEQEIAAQRLGTQADLFRFGTIPADLTDAQSFFLSPRWYIPGHDAASPLIGGVGEMVADVDNSAY